MKKGSITHILLIGCLTLGAFAQQPAKTAAPSGGSTTGSAPERSSITLYEKTVAVKYEAPSLKGRKILGGVVPLKQAWPVGGAMPATLHTEGDLVFKGVVVPKGDYSLYLLADAEKWQLIINKQTGPKAGTYNPKMDLGRVPMILRTSEAPVETCRLTLSKSAARAARIELALEKTVGSAPFALDWAPGEPEW